MIRPFVSLVLAASTLPAVLPAQTSHHPPAAGIDTAGMDRSVKPGDNFFAYANGTWLARTEIPADRSSYTTGAIVADLTDKRVVELIQEAAKAQAPAGSDSRKIGDYYASFMDSAAIDAAGLKPLQPTLDSIAAIRDRKDLARFLGSTLRADVDALQRHQLLHREPVRPLGRAGPGRSDAVLSVPAPGRTRHARPRLLRGHLRRPWPRSVPSTSSTSPPCSAWPGSPEAEPKAAAIMQLETAHRERALDPRAIGRHRPRATITGAAPTSAARRRGSTGRRTSPPPAWRSPRGSSCGSRAPSPASRRSPRASRSTRGRTTSRSTPSSRAWPCCPRRCTTSRSRSSVRC